MLFVHGLANFSNNTTNLFANLVKFVDQVINRQKLKRRTVSIQNVGAEEDIFIKLRIIAICLQLSL